MALAAEFRVGHHGLLVAQMLAHIDFLDESLTAIDSKIESAVTVHAEVIERLTTIPGVARKSAIALIAEIGVDMSVFPTAAHLASWAGICPGNNASGGKRRAGRTRHGLGEPENGPDRGRAGSSAHPGHLPGRPSRHRARATRPVQGDRRDPP
jgi:Transposase IS116/IS110/IS902 family